jgi:undecaprenyl-diphosphatase
MSTQSEKQIAVKPGEVLRRDGNESNLDGVLRSWRALILSLSSSVVLLILFAWLSDEVFAGELQRFDMAVRMTVHEIFSPQLTKVMQAVTFVGSIGFLFVLFLAITTFWIVLKKYRSAVWLGIASGGSVILDVSLKLSFHRPRPMPFVGKTPWSYSFPSGHSLSSFCFYGVLAALICTRIPSRAWRTVIWLVTATLVLAIGISRVYLGVHYPTDVLAGYIAAGMWLSALLLALYSRRELQFRRASR